MTLGSNIQTLRKANGWSVLQLAEKSGIGYPTLLNTEKDKSKPHAATLAKLATLFGVETLEGDVVPPHASTEGEETSSSVGDNIKRLRDAKGWTQKALAEAADVALPTISNLENGKGSPRASTLLKIQQVLGVTSLNSVPASTPEPSPEEGGASAGEIIRLARKKLGWTQKELAEKADVAMPTIGGVESGKGSPRGSTLTRILDALGLTADDLKAPPVVTTAPTVDVPVVAAPTVEAPVGLKAPVVALAPNDTALYIDLPPQILASLVAFSKSGLYKGTQPEDVAAEILSNAVRGILRSDEPVVLSRTHENGAVQEV